MNIKDLDKIKSFLEDTQRQEAYQGSSSKPISTTIGHTTEIDLSKQRDEEIFYEIRYLSMIEKLKQEFYIEREKLISMLELKDKKIKELEDNKEKITLMYQDIIAHKLFKITILVGTISILGWIAIFLYK